MAAVVQRQVPEWKTREVENLASLINKHRIVGIASLYKVRTVQLQQVKRALGKDVTVRVAKNTLVRRAVKECGEGKKNIGELLGKLTKENVFLFTDMNPFRLSLLLNKSKVRISAKAGDVVQDDVMVPAGNTGLPPGPMISELQAVGIPTRIETGSVWVAKDTVVAKKGQKLTPRLASMLSRLGIKPLEVGLSMVAAYDDGRVYTGEDLKVDVETVRQQMQDGWAQAFSLAVNAAYPTSATIGVILRKARESALALSINAAFPTNETIGHLLQLAHARAASLSGALPEAGSSKEKG
jgi:large subunit ribosomal protein L10